MRAEHVADPGGPLTLHLEYELPGWFSVSGNRLIGRVPAVLEAAYLKPTPIEQRSSPFDVQHPLQLESRVRLVAPPGFVMSGRGGASSSAPNARYLDYRGSIQSVPGEATISFDAELRPGRHPASDYTGYHRESSVGLTFFDGAIGLRGP